MGWEEVGSSIKISENNVDNRLVVEVFGRQIHLNAILAKLEDALSGKSKKAEEVRFIAGTVFHVDANLDKEVWRGRNIVVYSDAVIVCQPVCWDVSGKDSHHVYDANAGTATDGNGLNGQDGYPGESGGNVLIIAKRVQCLEKLTILSNGGNGSKGQDGGNGAAGKDGKGICKVEFDDSFPRVGVVDPYKNLQTTYSSLIRKKHTVLDEWAHRSIFFHQTTYTTNVLKALKSADGIATFNVFYRCMTEDGHRITFSYEPGKVLAVVQAFLLCEGSPGTVGKPGGEYGLGGEGGKPGEVKIVINDQHVDANCCTKIGADGVNGRGGVHGRHGKRGWDMAYMDWSLGRINDSWPKFYGRDKNSSVKLDYFSSSASDRVSCPYKKDTGYPYAEMTESRIDNKTIATLEERNNSRSNSERQHHAKAVGKKTISSQRVLNTYAEFMNAVETEIRAEQRAAQTAAELEKQEQLRAVEIRKQLRAELKAYHKTASQRSAIYLQEANQMLQELKIDDADKTVQNEMQACSSTQAELPINRQVPFNPGTDYRKVKVKINPRGKGNADERRFTKSDSLNLQDWHELNTFAIDLEGLKKLLLDFENVKASLSDPESQENIAHIAAVEKIFTAKYKLAACHEIAHVLGLEQTIKRQPTVQVQIASKHLTESKTKDSLIGHTALGAMKQYIFENTEEQRANIAQYVGKELKHDDVALQRAVKVFVLETEYEELLQESLEALQKELRKPQHETIRRVWDGFGDQPPVDGVRQMMERDETLKTLYDRWCELKRTTSQYESAQTPCVDEGVKAKFIAHVRSKGSTSKCGRALLAYLYNVNLKVYGRDEDYELVLREDHNSSADATTHILCRGNEFGQLKVNEEYLKLEHDRLQRDRVCGKILREMDCLDSIEEIDNYLGQRCALLQSDGEIFEEWLDDGTYAAVTIAHYFPADERDELCNMLEKLSFDNCKQEGILELMLFRFSCEGKHISFNEMCFLVNAVLDHFANDGQEEYYFAWIVAANSQRYWLDEIVLGQLETYFKKQLTDEQQLWREYMRKIDNREVLLAFAAELQASVCSVECIGEILQLLGNVPIESMYFDGIPLSEWGYFLKEHYWAHELSSVLEWGSTRSLSDAIYYIRSVENTFGDSKANALLHNIKGKRPAVVEATLLDSLVNLHKQKWKLPDEDIRRFECGTLQEWISYMGRKYKPTLEEFQIEQLTEIVRNDEISSPEVSKHLPEIETSIHNISAKQIKYRETAVALFTHSEIKTWAKEFREMWDHCSGSVEHSLRTYEEMLAVIDRAIELRRGFRLRDTQRLAVLVLLTYHRSALAQVSTGEGKSLIVVALSLIKALLGEQVDIVTSSPVLAKRDAEVNNDIYSLFDIGVSHNCNDNVEQRKDAYSMHPVVYGDLANYQRDYLLDRFYGKSMLGDRDFTNVIVDEVDSMLLDKGNNMLYLSHDIPGMDKLESVYIFIWQVINHPNEHPETIDTATVYELVLNSMYHTVRLDDLRQLDKGLSVRKVNMIWNCLVEAEILNEEGHIIGETFDSQRLAAVLLPEVKHYSNRLNFLLRECVEHELPIRVPNYLKNFVKRHLPSWIISATNALLMIPGQSYVVDYNKAGSKADRTVSIIILDKDTGADQGSSQWDEALHQFLQLKHGCKLSMQSLKAVFVSNVTYFKLYRLLYGLTGTLGSQRERTLLKEIHEVAFVTIPNAKSKQFEEYEPIISPNRRKWIESIKLEAHKLISEAKRSVLIVCDTINDVDCVYNALKEKFTNSIHTYTRDYQAFQVVEGGKRLHQGQIIVATNLAGRGTDIRITDGLKNAGGLHVMLTYLPENIRIEEQGFGRAARSGEKGSGRLLIMVSSVKQFKQSQIIDLKKKRDQNELYRIADIKTHYEKTISAEEICFDEFKMVYEMHRKGLDMADVPDEVKTVLLESCLDEWAFWLDRYSDSMEDIMHDTDSRNIPTVLKKFLSKLLKLGTGVDGAYFDSNRWQNWVSGNPMRMVRLANYLSEYHVRKSTIMEDVKQGVKNVANVVYENAFTVEKHIPLAYETAMRLYEDAIQTEPHFSEAAYYYRAYTSMKTIDWKENEQSVAHRKKCADFKKDLRQAVRLFEARCVFAMQAVAIVEKLKGHSVWYEEYKAQKDSMCQLYQAFIRSIDDVLGHAVTPATFVNTNITEPLSERIFTTLLEKGVIARPKVRKTLSDRQLYSIHLDYGISMEALQMFLKQQAGPIVEEHFLEMCRKSFALPSREQFWEILIDQKVLHSVKKYALVDTVKLAVIDPSLADALEVAAQSKTLIKETLIELDKEQILLYPDLVMLSDANDGASEANSSKVQAFEKDHFITCIGREKFAMLARKCIVRCNEKANIDVTMIASCRFPSSFDSISAVDIAQKANIAIEEANLIIEELVCRKTLVRNGDAYVLAEESSSSVPDDLLPSCRLYECAIRAILASCFAYRLALNNVQAQLERNQQPVRIQLTCNPYAELFRDLVHQNIIRPMMVKEANLKDTLDELFSTNKFKKLIFNQPVPEPSLLSKSLYLSAVDSKRLYDQIFDSSKSFTQVGTVLVNVFTSLVGMAKRTGVRDEKSKSGTQKITIKFEPTNQTPELLRYDMSKTIEGFLAQQSVFYENETRSHIERVLMQSLVGLKVPDVHLKSVRVATKLVEKNYGNIEEEQLFSLNGLAQLLQLEEKRWTKEMLINTNIVLAIGVAEIALGLYIEVRFAGAMTHVGSGLMSEGAGDIMYAVKSFHSGYFSWDDYRSQKWESILLTVATTGVAACVSRGVKLSRIANKVAGPGLTKGGKEVGQMAGRALIREIGGRQVFNLVVKRFAMKVMEGLALGAASVMVDKFTDDYLKSIIETIAEDMLAQMVRSVDDHKIAETLRKTYDRLGEEQASQLVLELHAFGSNDWGTCISYTKQIASSLSQGFTRALQKTPNQTRALKILSNISTAWVWTERAIELGKLMTVVGTFLDQLDYKMNEKLNSTIKQRSSPVSEASRPNGKFEEFRAKIVNEWKAQLTEHVRSIIAQHLVKPLLHDTLYRVGRLIKRVPRNIRQGMLKRRTKRLLQKHAQRMQDSSLSQETKANLRQEYHDKLLKILYKTKSPSLFASIIRENVPMDLTCAAACTPVVHELLSNMGKHVDGITITVKGEHGIEQTFCSGSLEGKNVREVTLQLKDNHFTFSDNQRNTANNNCLYAALSAAIPELETIGAEQLREQIANTIRDDTGLQHRIRQGWHRFPIKKYGAVGGRSLPPEEGPKRAKTFRQQPARLAAPRASDEDRLKSLAVEFEEYTPPENCPNAKSAALHLYARVTIYDYEFAGLVQGIAVKTGISVEELIEQGPSNCKDQLKLVKGGHIHRAHTVRVKVNEQALKNWPEELAKLKQYAGHREYVCKEANQFDKIGGVIDRKQMMWIKQLVKTHDFSKTPTANDKLSMQKHLEEAGQVFDVNHTAGKYDATMIQQMRLAKEKILNVDLEKLHEYGQYGYNIMNKQ